MYIHGILLPNVYNMIINYFFFLQQQNNCQVYKFYTHTQVSYAKTCIFHAMTTVQDKSLAEVSMCQ